MKAKKHEVKTRILVAKQIDASPRYIYLDQDGGWQIDRSEAHSFTSELEAAVYANNLANLFPGQIFGLHISGH